MTKKWVKVKLLIDACPMDSVLSGEPSFYATQWRLGLYIAPKIIDGTRSIVEVEIPVNVKYDESVLQPVRAEEVNEL